MIFLQGAARPDSPAGACLDLAEQAIIELCISPEILAEVADVLGRPRLRARFPSLTDHLVSEFLDVVRSLATLVDDNAGAHTTLCILLVWPIPNLSSFGQFLGRLARFPTDGQA